MNLIQTLPAPSPFNMRFMDAVMDHGKTFGLVATYDAGGPRIQVAELREFGDIPIHKRSRQSIMDMGREMQVACIEQIKQAMAEHLAIINPIDND
jgi:hypothetical protein